MATARIDTGGAVTATSTRNNRGTIKAANAGRVGSVIRSEGLGDGFRDKAYQQFTASATFGAAKPYSSGTFAYNGVPGRYIGKIFGAYISGVSNLTLRSGGSDYGFRRSINGIEKNRSSFLQSWSWSTDNAGTPQEIVYTGVYRDTNQTYSDDHVLDASRLVPGEFTYKYGKPNPTNADYSKKTNG